MMFKDKNWIPIVSGKRIADLGLHSMLKEIFESLIYSKLFIDGEKVSSPISLGVERK